MAPWYSTLEVAPHLAPEYIQSQGQIITDDRKPTPERRICRLRVTTFWLCLALVAVLLLALVGGVVGSVLGSRHSSTDNSPSTSTTLSMSSSTPASLSTSTPTSSSTSTASSTSSTNTPIPSAVPSNECPGSNNTEYTAPLTGSNFLITCGIDWRSGVPAADGNGTVQDLIGIYSDSMEECIDGCASYNHNQGGTPCMAVSYTANLTEFWVPQQHANCFLKDKVGANSIVDSVTCAKLVSS